jgi:hypothetical protein
MAMTTTRPVQIVRLLSSDTLVAPLVLEVPCDGMGRVVGNIGYDAVVAAPTIEFSEDDLNWDSIQSATVDATAAAGITLYRFDIAIGAWKFVRITIPNPPGGNFVRGGARLLPVEEA